MRLLFFLIAFCSVQLSFAQLYLDTSLSARDLIQKVLLEKNSDLLIRNIKYTGTRYSIGAFQTVQKEVLIDRGIILSTGDVFDAMGPNKKVNTGSRTSARADQDLQAIATGITTDAAVLEFDLLSLRDSLAFIYVFASEEYPEYVNQGVNDVFGFFIQEIGSKAIHPRNLAVLPDGRTTVSIDNINHRRNEEYFLPSDFLHVHPNSFWQEHKAMAMRARIYEFDGFTVPLKATVRLKEGKWYHFKIAIADVGDRVFDSAVMLKAKTFGAKGKKIPQADEIVKEFVKEKLSEIKSIATAKDGKLSFDLAVQFNTNEDIIQKPSYSKLEQLIEILNDFPSLHLDIIGHTDNQGNSAANLTLSKKRAVAVKNYLASKKIDPKRLKTSGKGDKEPKVSNQSESGRYTNRRVEFKLIY